MCKWCSYIVIGYVFDIGVPGPNAITDTNGQPPTINGINDKGLYVGDNTEVIMLWFDL